MATETMTAEQWTAMDRSEMRRDTLNLADWLRANPNAREVHQHVADQIQYGISGTRLVMNWGEVIDALAPDIAQKLVSGFDHHKLVHAATAIKLIDRAWCNSNAQMVGLFTKYAPTEEQVSNV